MSVQTNAPEVVVRPRRDLLGRQGRVGALLLTLIVGTAAYGFLFLPDGAGKARVGLPYEEPTAAHPLGTDDLGRDLPALDGQARHIELTRSRILLRQIPDESTLRLVLHLRASGDATREMFATLGPGRLLSAHSKGVAVEDKLIIHMSETVTGAPDDLFDHAALLREAARMPKDFYVALEHLPVERMAAARQHLLNVAAQIGVEFE